MMTARRLGCVSRVWPEPVGSELPAWNVPGEALRILAECEKSSGTMPDSSDRMSTLQAGPAGKITTTQ